MKEMPVPSLPCEPALRTGALLIKHWVHNKDVEAAIMLMAEIGTREEAEDVITALLLLHGRSAAQLNALILGVPA